MVDQGPLPRQAQANQALQQKTWHSKSIVYVCATGMFFSMISNLTKADYNIALFFFVYLTHMYSQNLKFQCKFLLVYSIVIDVLWAAFIHYTVYSSSQFVKLVPWESSNRATGSVMVFLNMALKGFLSAIFFLCDNSARSH